MGFFDRRRRLAPEPRAIDLSRIDSKEKARKAVRRGELTPMFLMAPRFGGVESELNAVYVPHAVAALKEALDDRIEELVTRGTVRSYSAEPVYAGASLVPQSVRVTCGKDGVDVLTETLEVW